MHEEQHRRPAVGRAARQVVEEVAVRLVTGKVVTPAGNQEVETHLEGGVDGEDAGEVLRRLHLRHELEVEPVPRVGEDNVRHGTEDREDGDVLSEEEGPGVLRAPPRGQPRHHDGEHREDEEEVQQAEPHGFGEAPQNHRERQHGDAAGHDSHGEAQLHLVKDSLEGLAEDQEVGGLAEEGKPVDQGVNYSSRLVAAQRETAGLAHGHGLLAQGLGQHLARPGHQQGNVDCHGAKQHDEGDGEDPA
mmetsp:Transcript_19359/g.61447  ORF Transcript_19359/g.61447 Transcript_19359/m.61447 type:complete len:246 (+) Transcript_19359:902-1639(+)